MNHLSRTYLFVLILLLFCPPSNFAQTYRYEAEDGDLNEVYVDNSFGGFSGTGYVTGFDNRDAPVDSVELFVDVPEGLYEMWIGYRSPFGEKGYDYRVDDEFGSGMFDQSNSFSADRAGLFHLDDGINTLGIYEGWAFYDVDYLEFRPFSPPELAPVSPLLVDAEASYSTQVLMNYLTHQYGRKTLSGQQHEVSENLSFPVANYLNKSGGIVPAIRGSDLIDYSPSRVLHGENPRNEAEETIAWAKQTGGIVTMMWHWNAPTDLVDDPCGSQCGPNDYPWWRGFYTNGTTFDLPGALANPGGSDYQLLLRDIDAIAAELQKFEDAGVPVIWRPLHEAQGGWFWWGAHGSEAFKELWDLTYDRLTNVHGLHNLIWEFTSSAAEGDHLQWYPGDDVVDMVGLDIYTAQGASMSGQWYDVLEHYDGRKMIALSETGTLPDPELMDQWGIEWSYFSPWAGSFVDSMSAEDLEATLNHEDIIVLDELPVLPWKEEGMFLSADLDFNGRVDEEDLLIWRQSYPDSAAGDMDGDGKTTGSDFLVWQRQAGLSNGTESSQQIVPEPSSFVYVFLAFFCGGFPKSGRLFPPRLHAQ